jgi:hypothetical protein
MAAEWVIERARTPTAGGERRRIALVGATAADVRDVMVEGESGILACSPPDFTPDYEPSKRRLTWPNGTTATTYSADKPRQLRGPQHHDGWADEIAAWRYTDAWDQLQFGLRLGDNPQCVATTTPRIRQFLRDLMADPSTRTTRGSTYENRANLPRKFFEKVIKRYEGTRLGEQELKGELLDVLAGAVFPEFADAEHVIPWRFDPTLPVVLGWDFGVTRPSVLIAQEVGDFGHVLPDGRWLPPNALVVFREVQQDDTPTQRLIPVVARALGGSARIEEYWSGGIRHDWHRYEGPRVAMIACDPAGDARDQHTGMSGVEMLEFAFGRCVRFETDPRERDVAAGVERMQLALAPGGEPTRTEIWHGRPEFYVSQELADSRERRGIVASFKGYSYPEKKPGQAATNLPHKDGEFDHAMDAARYLLINAQNRRGYTGVPTLRAVHGHGY